VNKIWTLQSPKNHLGFNNNNKEAQDKESHEGKTHILIVGPRVREVMGLWRSCFSMKAGILNYPQQTNKQASKQASKS
jgi:hypothetical protein